MNKCLRGYTFQRKKGSKLATRQIIGWCVPAADPRRRDPGHVVHVTSRGVAGVLRIGGRVSTVIAVLEMISQAQAVAMESQISALVTTGRIEP
jgi:hypothetical protein